MKNILKDRTQNLVQLLKAYMIALAFVGGLFLGLLIMRLFDFYTLCKTVGY